VVLLLLAHSLAAQGDPSGTWRTLHTEHFRVHFRPGYRTLAVDAANEAERAYGLLARELHPPRGVIDLTLADDVDTPNGFASTYPSNRITIYLVPPVADPALQAFDHWQRLVIVHELTHIFHLDRTRGLWRTAQRVFGRVPGLFPNQYQPSWVTEGLATYYESRFTAGGRAAGSFHRELVAADVRGGDARSPWDALQFTRWPAGLAPYAYGSRFWEYLARGVSDTLPARFIERSAGQFIPFRVGRPLRHAGVPRSLAAEWRAATRLAVRDSTFQSGRVIAAALRTQPVPRVSPDGRRLAYVHDDGRSRRVLRVIDPASGTVQREHHVNGNVSYDWSGDTLLVAQLDFTDRWRVRNDLWKWTPDGRWTQMTSGARLSEPRGGRDVRALIELHEGDNIPTVSGDGARPPADPPGTTWGAVVPSPDGSWLAGTRHQNGHWALVRWPANRPAELATLVQAGGASIITDPSWTRDGSGVLYVSDQSGSPQVYRWTAGQGPMVLTDEPLGARAPAELPGGELLITNVSHRGWELRAVTPAPRVAPPAPPAEPFDSASPVPIRESRVSLLPSLRPHFWIPLAFDAADAGFFVGAATAGVDALGRYAYYADAEVAPSPLRVQGAFALVSNALGDPTLDVSASNDWSFVGTDSTGHAVSGAHQEAAVGATFIAQRWQRFVSLRVAAEWDARQYRVAPDTALDAICSGCRQRDLVGGSASLAFGTAVSAPLAVSLQDGFTVSLLYRRREQQGSPRWLNEVRGRLTLYARAGPRVGFAYPVLGVRLATGAFDGPIVDRLAVGGASSSVTDLGFGQALGTNRTFPVRGYDAGSLRGRRAASATVEYRVPLALIGKSLGHLPLGADKLAITFFGDVGDAWEIGERARLHRLRSAGAELVADLSVSYDIPIRLRIGVAQPANGQPRVYTAFGSNF
jgi:hypothetical protein